MKRIQHMPPVLFTVDWKNLQDKHTYVWFYPDPKSDEKLRSEMPLKEALDKCANAERGGFEVFVSAYVPAFKQHMVVAMTTHGRLHSAFFGNPGKEAEKALAALLGTSGDIQTQTGKQMSMQVIKPVQDKKDTRLACRVVFPRCNESGELVEYSTKEYTYKCRAAHVEGDMVTVKVEKENGSFELKIVKVVSCFVTTEREIAELAMKLKIKEIKELYCEEAIEL